MNQAQEFQKNGIIKLQNFYSKEELLRVHSELAQAEEEAHTDLQLNWDNQKVTFFTSLKDDEEFVTTKYFQASATKTHVFFENIGDEMAVNRIGHGLHLDPTKKTIHKSIFENSDLNKVLKASGLKHPHCLLSVYIPKHSNGHGSEVKPHQESSFAHTAPLSTKVLWVALEDSTIENACMWGLPGSHKSPLKFISKVNHKEKSRAYEQLSNISIPEFNESKSPYTPLEVKAGDALLFDGNYVHCSPENKSNKSRKAISFQFIETDNTKFSTFNWIQKPTLKRIY